jgi:hypothetical protein
MLLIAMAEHGRFNDSGAGASGASGPEGRLRRWRRVIREALGSDTPPPMIGGVPYVPRWLEAGAQASDPPGEAGTKPDAAPSSEAGDHS